MRSSGINRIAIVGAGTMGQGIGQEFARAGYEVILQRRSREKLEQSKQSIRCNLDEMAQWDLVLADEIEATLSRIEMTTSLEEAGSSADLIVEAVSEDLELKRQIFQDLDRACPVHAILTSNTSSFMPDWLASATNRRDRVLVLHFCYPPHLLPLVEIVPGNTTSEETVRTLVNLMRHMNKTPVLLHKAAPGFIINRLQAALLREALNIVEQGIATAQDVDIAVKNSFGRRLAVAGPIETAEVMDDWNQTLQFNRVILPDLDVSREPSPLMLDKVAKGHLGAKTGQGFYEWSPQYAEKWRSRLWKRLAGSLRSDLESR